MQVIYLDMSSVNELIELTKQYILYCMQPKNRLDIFITYWISIIQVLLILGGAGAGLWKYYRIKNKETNEKILNEVYSPLYQYLVKQELYRKIHKIAGDYKDTPILEITNTKTTVRVSGITRSSEPVCGLSRKEIIKIKDSLNIGLASKEILTLLNMYQVVDLMEDKYDKDTNEYIEATILKVEIENALRKEVISGYKKYHHSLGLKKVSKSGLWTLTEDNIEYTYRIDEEEKNYYVRTLKRILKNIKLYDMQFKGPNPDEYPL